MVNLFDDDVASWEQLARTDPLWAVLSSDEFHDETLTAEAESRFWASGQEHVAHVLSILRNELDASFTPSVALDFGCGVGRNLVPLAGASRRAVGLDASATMVRRTEARLSACGVTNGTAEVIGRRIASDQLQRWGRVDFVHSVLVFQHIVAPEGLALFDQLLGILAPGGCGFAQFHCKSPGGEVDRIVRGLRLRNRIVNSAILRSRIRRLTDVVMLYEYDVLDLLRHLAAHRISEVVIERTDTGRGGYDVRLYFMKFEGTEEEFTLGGRSMNVRSRP